MRTSLLLYISLLASSSYTAAAIQFPSLRKATQPQIIDQQSPMNGLPVQLPSGNGPNTGGDDHGNQGPLTISDILPKTRSINIFASLTRDIASITSRLESGDPADNTTLLAPLNSAMQALPRKPWEDRPDDTSGVSAARNEDKAAANIDKFVSEHTVPISPWVEGKEGKMKTLGGGELWWEKRGDKKVVMPGEVEVDGVVGKVGNGEVWALKGVVNYR